MTITDRKIKYEAVIQHNAQRRHKNPQEQVNVEQDVKFPPISVCFDEIFGDLAATRSKTRVKTQSRGAP